MKAKEMCEDCGKVFLAGKREFLCPQCKRNRLRKYAKDRKLNEIGNNARIK